MGVVHAPSHPVLTIGVTAGMHGHEPGGVAAALNLIHLLEYGKDLSGRRWDAVLRRIKFVVVPVLNVDARARCLDDFVGLTFEQLRLDANGYTAGGTLLSRRRRMRLKHRAHLGGFYNDAGYDILNATDGRNLAGTDSVELRLAVSFFQAEGVDVAVDLHAHGFPPMFYVPLGLVPKAVSQAGFNVAEKVRRAARKVGLPFAAPEQVAARKKCDGPVNVFSSALHHNVYGALPFLFEGPQGIIGCYKGFYGGRERILRDPGLPHAQIIFIYLFVIQEIVRTLKALRDKKKLITVKRYSIARF